MSTSTNTPSHDLSPASALVGDPAKFGRVDADGIVYVKTSTGEKAVGSYPDKTSEEALAYFVRKFELLASEVALLAARIKNGSIVPSDAHQAVAKLRQQVAASNAVGDLETLMASVESIPALIEANVHAYQERKAAAQALKTEKEAQAKAIKEKIVASAEELIESTSWKSTTEKFAQLLAEWKAAPRLEKAADSELWKRFSHARNKFDKRRRVHFAQLLENHDRVAEIKSALVAEAEKLSTSKEWLTTANKFKALMDQWKTAGRGKKNVDDKLWNKFKSAQDAFFAAKSADMEKRNESMGINLEKRQELMPEFEALLHATDAKSARSKFRELSEKWSKIGVTDRNKRAALEARIDAVNDHIASLEKAIARRTDSGAKARALEVVEQLKQAIAKYERQETTARTRGDLKAAKEAADSASARREWLVQAEKQLSEFA